MGLFLGSGTALFKDQLAADIYRQYIWAALGLVQRVAHICVTYGISAAVVLLGDITQVGEMPDTWYIHPPSLHTIDVEDEGTEFMDVDGAPSSLPNSHMLPDLDDDDEAAFYVIGRGVIAAKPVPWHHRVTLRQSKPNETLHYHEHDARKGHGDPSVILPQNEGKYREFDTLVYGTQVQMCRSTEGVVRCINPRKPPKAPRKPSKAQRQPKILLAAA